MVDFEHVEPSSYIVGLEWRLAENLVANPHNYRLHPADQWEVLRDSLKENGWVQALIENKRTGYLLDGHLRAQLAVELGIQKVPVLVVDVDPADEAKILVCLDPIAAMAGTEEAALKELIEAIETESEPIRLMMDELLANATEVEVPDDAEKEKEEKKRTRRVLLQRARQLLRRFETEGRKHPEERWLDRAAEQMRDVVNTIEGG
jgi:ParB-like chromosome segregation protein Spo0J